MEKLFIGGVDSCIIEEGESDKKKIIINGNDKYSFFENDNENNKLLGSGGFGQVSICNKNDCVYISLKKIKIKNPSKQEKEIEILKEIKNNEELKLYAVEFFFACQYKNEYYIFAELLTETLSQYINNANYNLENNAYICDKLLRGLQVFHDNNLFHRDIKPANIMLTYKGNKVDKVKYIDFGLSCRNEKKNRKSDCEFYGGTEKYICPLMYSADLSNEDILVKIDRFALGLTIFYLLNKHTYTKFIDGVNNVNDFYKNDLFNHYNQHYENNNVEKKLTNYIVNSNNGKVYVKIFDLINYNEIYDLKNLIKITDTKTEIAKNKKATRKLNYVESDDLIGKEAKEAKAMRKAMRKATSTANKMEKNEKKVKDRQLSESFKEKKNNFVQLISNLLTLCNYINMLKDSEKILQGKNQEICKYLIKYLGVIKSKLLPNENDCILMLSNNYIEFILNNEKKTKDKIDIEKHFTNKTITKPDDILDIHKAIIDIKKQLNEHLNKQYVNMDSYTIDFNNLISRDEMTDDFLYEIQNIKILLKYIEKNVVIKPFLDPLKTYLLSISNIYNNKNKFYKENHPDLKTIIENLKKIENRTTNNKYSLLHLNNIPTLNQENKNTHSLSTKFLKTIKHLTSRMLYSKKLYPIDESRPTQGGNTRNNRKKTRKQRRKSR